MSVMVHVSGCILVVHGCRLTATPTSGVVRYCNGPRDSPLGRELQDGAPCS